MTTWKRSALAAAAALTLALPAVGHEKRHTHNYPGHATDGLSTREDLRTRDDLNTRGDRDWSVKTDDAARRSDVREEAGTVAQDKDADRCISTSGYIYNRGQRGFLDCQRAPNAELQHSTTD
jgi:hypothetical protein